MRPFLPGVPLPRLTRARWGEPAAVGIHARERLYVSLRHGPVVVLRYRGDAYRSGSWLVVAFGRRAEW